jgi:hypothetical protein
MTSLATPNVNKRNARLKRPNTANASSMTEVELAGHCHGKAKAIFRVGPTAKSLKLLATRFEIFAYFEVERLNVTMPTIGYLSPMEFEQKAGLA